MTGFSNQARTSATKLRPTPKSTVVKPRLKKPHLVTPKIVKPSSFTVNQHKSLKAAVMKTAKASPRPQTMLNNFARPKSHKGLISVANKTAQEIATDEVPPNRTQVAGIVQVHDALDTPVHSSIIPHADKFGIPIPPKTKYQLVN